MKTKNYSSKMTELSNKIKTSEHQFQLLHQRMQGAWRDDRSQEFDKKYMDSLADLLQSTYHMLRSYEHRIRQIENKLSN